MKAIKFIFILSIGLTLISCNSSDDTIAVGETPEIVPVDYYEALDLSYGQDSKQTFDIYLPANRTTDTKVIILVHGGGWSSGDKNDMDLFKNLIRQDLPDMAVVNINYRLADENNSPFPMQINDITSIINNLKSMDDELIFSEDYAFIGVSAGAHLSMLWSYGFDPSNNVNMVCSIVGPTNFTDPAYLNSENPALQELIALYGVNPTTAFLEEVSPFHRATINSPPTILFYGGQDPLIPTTQGVAMKTKLDDLNIVNEFTLYPDQGHGWIGLELIDTWTKLKAFTQLHL